MGENKIGDNKNIDKNKVENVKKNFIEYIYNMIFPKNLNCIICNMPISRNNKYSLCKKCAQSMNFISDSCVICGKPHINFNLDEEIYTQNCPYCKGKRFLFDRNISFIEYDEVSKNIVFDLKYRGKTYLAKIIAQIMFDGIKKISQEDLNSADYIMYVPLSKKRYEERGFNQSEKIAYYLSKLSGIEKIDGIKRIKNTKKLHKIKSDERKKELSKAFLIEEIFKEKLCGKDVIIVDDIFTTGSTVDEISKELKLCGVERVVVLTLLTGKYVKEVDKE